MAREILSEENIDPEIRGRIEKHHRDIVEEVQGAIKDHAVVVVGMSQNPFPKKARAALRGANITFHYLEYGSYLSTWRPRTALKMWTGWPTFPMIFVKGILIGGFEELSKLLSSGELQKRISEG